MKLTKTKTKFKQTEVGMIPEDWEIKTFSSVLLGKTRNGLYKSKEFRGKGIKMINMGELFKYDKIGDCDMELVELSNSEKQKFLVKPGDLLFARRSLVAEGAGKCSLIVGNAERTFESSIIMARPNPKEANSEYLFYLFKSKFGKFLLDTILRQVAVSGITGSDLMRLNIPIPPLPEQHYIAKILSELDSKIELNHRVNKTLEAIGQAIFKYWFIDFEFPNEEGKLYKSSGGEMVDSELGKIPKGWKIKNVEDFIIFEKGVEPGSKVYSTKISEENIRFLRVGDVSSPRREQTFIPLNPTERKSCREDDILLTLDATIGIVRIGMKGVHSSGVRKVYSKENNVVPKSYIYSLLKSKEIQDTIYTYANGTTILHAGKSLNYMYVPVPDKIIFKEFADLAEPIFNKLVNNLVEITILENIRDSLLPKLMSGKIRVPVEVK